MQALTAFHDPAKHSCMLVSIRRNNESRRELVRVDRPYPQLVACCTITGKKSIVDRPPFAFVPAHGQVIGDAQYFAIPPDWRVSLPVEYVLPHQQEAWMRCVAFFVWGERGIAATQDLVTGAIQIFWDSVEAINSLDVDILFVCTPEAVEAIEQKRRSLNWSSFSSLFPVICNPDQFATATSLDRPPNGWYHAPFFFSPDCRRVMSLKMRNLYATALTTHRCEWIKRLGIIPMIFSLAALTKMPLHEIASPHQTQIADALIEQTWIDEPLQLDAPLVVRGEMDDECTKRFKGGSVLDATLGLHQTSLTAMPDVSALYPNVVREYLSDEYRLMARLFEKMIGRRSLQLDPVLADSVKLCTNSVFGSRKYGRYRCPRLSEQITECGRNVQKESLEALANELPTVRVVGGDTDSLVIRLRHGCDVPQTISSIVRVINGSRKFALYKSDVALYSSVFFVNNKCWAGVEASTGKIVTRGLALNRASIPKFVLQSHAEWISLVLKDESFNTSKSVREEWINARATLLRTIRHSIADLVIWPKPTREHSDINRAYVVVAPSRKHVPYSTYMELGTSQLAPDVDYLVEIYFEADILRQHVLLCSS